MATCNDCIHKDVCYLIEHYGRDLCSDDACDKFLATPVRHGYWIKTSLMFASSNGKHGNVHVCSNCGEQSGVGFKTPYCAICGAKMDEENS